MLYVLLQFNGNKLIDGHNNDKKAIRTICKSSSHPI